MARKETREKEEQPRMDGRKEAKKTENDHATDLTAEKDVARTLAPDAHWTTPFARRGNYAAAVSATRAKCASKSQKRFGSCR